VHELKLPVATIAIAADNMRHDLETLHVAEGERLRRAVGRISQQAARAARLMKQLTIYARNEQGDDAVSSVIEAVEGAKVLVDYRLRNSGVHLQTDLPDDLPMTVGSLLMLEQVLVNLLVNAVDAYVGTARTSPLVRITARVEGNCVLVTVSDRATGIPPDILKHIFDPFFSTKAAGQGTGLGLSFSRRVVMNMGGTINVNTGPSGTDFHVRLPIAHAGRHAVESVSPECPCRQ
jgi:two-component system NtrC family sensor kinase